MASIHLFVYRKGSCPLLGSLCYSWQGTPHPWQFQFKAFLPLFLPPFLAFFAPELCSEWRLCCMEGGMTLPCASAPASGPSPALIQQHLFFWPHRTACRILVPRPRIEPVPPALGAWSLNHWTTREVPQQHL